MKIGKFFIINIVCTLFICTPHLNAQTPKILVLIIASDQYEVYKQLQVLWRSYMHYDPEHVEAYFIKGDAQLPTLYKICDDVLWSKTAESWQAGVTNKTVLSLEALANRLHEFDYVLRTNLSSFYIFPRLLAYLETAPRTNFYCGSAGVIPGTDEKYGSGSGFIMSSDAALVIAHSKAEIFDNRYESDDILFGKVLLKRNIRLAPHSRVNIFSLDDWHLHQNNIPDDIFQVRVQCGNYDARLMYDIPIIEKLISMFY